MGRITEHNGKQLEWSETLAGGERLNYEDAVEAVAELGEGWRLPTLQELFGIADHSREEPAVDVETFPDTTIDWYWTSTTAAWNDTIVWGVGFSIGYVYGFRRNFSGCVRAVREV